MFSSLSLLLKRFKQDGRRFIQALIELLVLAWRASPFILVAILCVQLLNGLLPVLSAWVLKQIVDSVILAIQGETVVSQMLRLLALQLLFVIVDKALQPLNNFLTGELSRQLQEMTQAIVYKQIAKLRGIAYFENPAFYDTIRLSTQSLLTGPMQMVTALSTLVQMSVTLVSFLGILIFLSPLLTLIIVIASFPQLYAQLRFARHRLSVFTMNSPKERRAHYLGQLLSHIDYAKEMRLFQISDYFITKFLDLKHEIHINQRQQQRNETLVQFALDSISAIVQCLVLIYVILEALVENITIGDITLYISAATGVQGSLGGLMIAIGNINENALFFAHFQRLQELPPQIHISQSPQPIHPLKSKIVFQNVSFRYGETYPWVLRDVNLTIEKGDCVALVGLNGEGKTTLVKLLVRFYDPTEGRILWDGIDIREFDPDNLRQQITAIFQDFVRYELTVRENIGVGRITHIDDLIHIQHAAQKAGIDDLISRLPKKYDATLSRSLVEEEPGIDLSGGQWQKIAIARMMARNSDLVILDEPTAALDAEAEYAIYQDFSQLVNNKTSLLISHRFSTVRIANKIAVLERGEITEYGSHDTLLAQNGTYAHLYRLQTEQYGVSGND